MTIMPRSWILRGALCVVVLTTWSPARAQEQSAPPPLTAEKAIELTRIAPATPEEMAHYREFYKYDVTVPLNAEITDTKMRGNTRVIDFAFDSTHDQRVPGTLLLPGGGRSGPYPVVIFLHGYGGSRGDVNLFSLLFAEYAVLALDAQYHGDRKVSGRDIYSGHFYQSRDAVVQTIIDYRRALDWLATREDIAIDHVGLLGISMGAIMGSVLAGVDDRIQASVLIVGGGNWALLGALTQIGPGVELRRRTTLTPEALREINHTLAPCEPLHWISQIAPRPVLFENGRYDTIVPVPCSEQLHAVAAEPKEIHWHPTSHFVLPAAITRSRSFFKRHLKAAMEMETAQTDHADAGGAPRSEDSGDADPAKSAASEPVRRRPEKSPGSQFSARQAG